MHGFNQVHRFPANRIVLRQTDCIPISFNGSRARPKINSPRFFPPRDSPFLCCTLQIKHMTKKYFGQQTNIRSNGVSNRFDRAVMLLFS